MPEGEGPAIPTNPTMEAQSAPEVVDGAAGGEPGPEGPPMPPMEGAPEEMPAEAGGAQDLDSALAGVEAALTGMSDDAAREIRTHLEAIKDIASSEPEAQSHQDAPMPQEAPSPDMTMPSPDAPMDMSR